MSSRNTGRPLLAPPPHPCDPLREVFAGRSRKLEYGVYFYPTEKPVHGCSSNRKTNRKGDNMKNGNKLTVCVLACVFGFFAFCAVEKPAQAAGIKSGEDGFRKYCQACHPNGGNALKPAKNISKKVLEKNGIKTVNDIIKVMRKPGEDMTSFDEKTLPENEARKIAEYIVRTF